MKDSRLRPRRRRPRGRLAVLIVGVPLLAAVAAVLVAVGVHLAYAGQALPGVRVAGRDVGGLSAAQVRARLAPQVRAARSSGVVLVDGTRRFPISPADAGLQVDLAGTVRQAMRAGRGGGVISEAWAESTARWTTRALSLRVSVDRAQIRRAVAAVARRVDVTPSGGALRVDPASLTVSAVAPRAGRLVEQDRAATAVARALPATRTKRLALPVREVRPAVSAPAVQAVAAAARRYLAGPLRLRSAVGSLTVSPGVLADILRLERAGGGVRLGVDPAATRRLAGDLAAGFDVAPIPARIRTPARPPGPVFDTKTSASFTARRAQVTVAPGTVGRTVDQGALTREIGLRVRLGSHTGTLPATATRPRLTSALARRVDSLIGAFTTYHACCAPRVTNIHRIAQLVDNTVIMPGEQFSLNGVAGRRTTAKGFLPAPTIVGGRLVDTVGGGVSQFSTTTYNAAYFAGLALVSHQPHSFYISRYPVGREATLDYPGIDLVWRNDTPAPVVVRTSYTGTSVTVALYGQGTGRSVRSVTGPRRDWPPGDFQVTVTRTVAYADGTTRTEPYTTSYQRPPAGE